MKLKSVRELYLVKQMVLESVPEVGVKTRIMETINSVLLSESGAKAVLYPFNDFEKDIVALWGESMSPKDIANKLGIEDEEAVICVIQEAEAAKDKEE